MLPHFLRRLPLFVLLSLLLPGLPVLASTFQVTNPSDSGAGSLRAAIAGAASGDTIYFDPSVFSSSSPQTITLTSGQLAISQNLIIQGPGPGALTLSGNKSSRVFYITGSTVALSGLTVTNGIVVGFYGGGIYSTAANLTMTTCNITNNIAIDGNGAIGVCAGLFNAQGTVSLTNCNFSGNTARGECGGIDNGGTMTLSNCTLTGNSGSNAGAILGYGSLTLTGCTLSGNSATNGSGGAISCNGAVMLSQCSLSGNTATGDGGAISGSFDHGQLTGCLFSGNSAGGNGGALKSDGYYSALTATNCVFMSNTATGTGGGIQNGGNDGGVLTLMNCTLTANAAASGKGIKDGGFGTDTLSITNSIVYANGAAAGGNDISAANAPSIIFSDIGSPDYAGTGNLHVNPLFVSTPTDLHLQSGSPCLGAGTASGAPTATIDGKARPNPPSIGAYETAGAKTAAASTTTLSSSLNPSAAGQSVTFTAAVTGTGGTPTGTVTFTLDGTAQPAVALSSAGAAAFTTSALAGGSHSVTAAYSGDTIFAASKSAALTQTVNTLPTTTTLASSLNPSVYGQQVTLTATVTGKNLTGTVTFTDTTYGVTLGTGAISGGSAQFSLSSLAAGSHQITASYAGDTTNSQSVSAPLTQVVNQAGTITTLSSSLNPSSVGQSVVFKATVTGSGGTPTGSISYTVDGVTQPAVPLNHTYATSALAAGLHKVTASYTGDGNFSASTSSTLTQKVNPHISPQYVSPSGSDDNLGTQSSPKLTIQAAINTALSGDTVIIENGTYTGPGNVDLDFGGRNITVTSQNGAASTIINCAGSASSDGSGSHRGFYLHSNENGAVISSLTIENGYEATGNSGFGGGLLLSGVSATVQGCIITGNAADYGGGISCSGTITINNCSISSNTSTFGAGVYADTYGSTLTLTNSTLSGNTALSIGGGVYARVFSGGTNTVSNCVLSSNSAGINGGGIYNYSSTGSAAGIVNCLISGNTAASGSGIENEASGAAITVTNCTLTGNSATGTGSSSPYGAINNDNFNTYGSISITNTIVYGDAGGEVVNNSMSASAAVVTNCDILGGYLGTGNINSDPVFVYYPSDLHLQPGSPCLGAGTASGAPTLTIDGRTRPNPPSIGAYEAYLAPTAVVVANVSDIAGQTVTLSASLNPGARGIPGATLQFSVDGKAAGSAVTGDNSTPSGPARLLYTIPAGYAAGSHTITVTFAGDATDTASSGNGTLTVAAPTGTAATQARFFPRLGYESRMVGGKFQGSADGTTYTDLATITQTPASGQTTTVTFAQSAPYRFLRYLSPANGYGNIAELEFDSGTGATLQKIGGMPFGTPGSYLNSGMDFTKVFDGSTSTFFDAPTGNGDFAGIDQGAPGSGLGEIRFFPRPGFPARMTGGKFQGSTDGTTYTDLASVATQPQDGVFTVLTLSADPKTYRYLRYLSPNGGYGNVAEVSFYSGTGTSAVKLTGTPYGTPGSYLNSGMDFTKVFDGSTSTFFDAPTGNGDFAGIDQAGSAATLGEVHYFPRAGYEYRMTGGRFQGSKDGTTYTDLATVVSQPAGGQQTIAALTVDPKAYRYLRYLAPDGSYGNIAELGFYSGTGTSAAKLTGTPFGTAGSYANSGADFTKVFDGSTSTFFDAPYPGTGDFAGIDQGAAAVQTGKVAKVTITVGQPTE